MRVRGECSTGRRQRMSHDHLKDPPPPGTLAREQIQAMPDRILNENYGPACSSLYVRSASGCYIEDIDGRQYIDMALGGGTAILGHANRYITDRLVSRIQAGTIYAIPNPVAHQYGELLHEAMPWFPHFVFCSTGSEATMRAIRIARAFSGRRKIGLFSGCWHGSHDMVLVEEDYSGHEAEPRLFLKSAGTPEEMKDLIVFLPYNHSAAFDLIRKHRSELAMVMIEPSQGSNPRDDVVQFLRDLRIVTEENDVLLCFDEIITGGRLAPGGAQELYGIHADLAAYGKILGGGLPVGIIGGTEDVMSVIRPAAHSNRTPVFMGGTFSANPLSVAAGMEVMRYLRENAPGIYSSLNENGAALKNGINAFCAERNIPAYMTGIGSMLRLVFSGHHVKSRRERDFAEIPPEVQKEFYSSLLKSGVHTGTNRLNFLSIFHDQAIVQKVLNSYFENLERFNAAGKLRSPAE